MSPSRGRVLMNAIITRSKPGGIVRTLCHRLWRKYLAALAAQFLSVGPGIVAIMGDVSRVPGRPTAAYGHSVVEAFYPTAVVGTRGGAVRFLIEHGPGGRRIGGGVKGDLAVAVLRAISELADLAREGGTHLQVAIDNRRMADLVRGVTEDVAGSPVEVVDDASWQIARLFADLYDIPASPEDPEVRLPPLVVGTDGSTNQLSGAWAWVSSEGQHGWGEAASRLIDACELEAIWNALRHECDRDVLVLTDSRNAVMSIRRPGAGSGRVVDMALRVRDAMDRRLAAGFDSRVAWVRGHAGVGVNEIAHRLALNALRQVRYRTEASVVEAVAKRIVSDLEDATIPALRPRWMATAEEAHPGTSAGRIT